MKKKRAKVRIITRVHSDGTKQYVIQQKFLHYFWVDAWINSPIGHRCKDHFNTLEDAEEHLQYFL